MERGFRVLHEEGTSVSLIDEMFSWEQRQETVGLTHWQELDDRIAALARQRLGRAEPAEAEACPRG